MENLLDYRQIITKKIFLEHLSVIFIFSVLTVIVTFPVILDFASETTGLENCYDKCHMMWRFWWTDFSFENGLDFYNSNYMFYPDGVDIGGNLAYFTTIIGFVLIQLVDYTAAWNIIWFLGFVFGGYGCYLLANNFNKNFLSSIIAGIIFTFTTYHMSHSMSHIGLSMVVWIPIFVLFLFKLLEKQSKYYSIIGGIIFFLVSLTHLYYSLFITMFSIIFFTIYIFRQKKVSNKTFITNFSILFVIGLTSTSILFLTSPTSAVEIDHPLVQHMEFSVNMENLILPGFEHTINNISDDVMITSFYSFFDESPYQRHVENLVFLGYSVIFLSALAVIRYRQNHIWFWLLICGIFVVLSFGPELKIFNESTGIEMPDKVLYDTIPGWDEIRAPARFIVMANLSLAMLASYAVYGLIKNKFSTFKQQLVLTSIIGCVILFELSMIPYISSEHPSMPDVYEEIKNDKSKFAVLAAPIGGTGQAAMMSHPLILYHQIHHEKPIYGGHESRPSMDEMQNTQTYFLSMFHKFGAKDDVIKQTLATHGLSLFEHFDIKYVTIHKDLLIDSNQTVRIKQTMSEILNENIPIYEDKKLIVYKIPKSNSSEPFLLLGSGWYVFDSKNNVRATMETSEILIVNPTNSEIDIGLNLILSSFQNEKTNIVSMNNEEVNTFEIPTTPINIQIENLILVPGVNVVTLDTDKFELFEMNEAQFLDVYGNKTTKLTVSFKVQSISIVN